MKTPLLSFLSCLAAGSLLCAQNVIPGGTVSPREGFTKPGTEVLFTHGGSTQKVTKEIVLTNGLRVRPDGSVTLPNGETTTLRNNQLLTVQGNIENVALSPQGSAPVSSVVPPIKN